MRLIDADALNKEVGELWRDMDDVDFGELVRDFWKVLNHFPTVNAEPVRHGRWIAHPTELCWDVCSVCGTGCKRREEDNGAELQYNYQYCPWCGTKMDWGET